ncbi:MAG TPA: alpha/beta fold hydrolase [Syntrophales bacterium]|nr:alpha/beta fold hydrolase [Syntrophales bacterium]HNS53275.1 alpha/beta fold hydrolase [Syntrophales bacterium]
MTSTGYPPKRTTVTAAVLERDGRILIARRKRGDRMADKWEFPGGKLEEGETPEACLRREMQEEFGIEVAVGPFVGRSLHAYPHGEIDLVAYRVNHLCGVFQLRDHEEIRWVCPADLGFYDFSAADIPIARMLARQGGGGTADDSPSERFLQIGGLPLRILERGRRAGRPLLLLHGTGDNAHTWDLLAPALAGAFRVLALDQRGHGKSGWAVPPAYRCEDYLQDLSAVIDSLGLEGLILLGHSMGALHASLYAALNPGRVAALIHVDIEPFPPDWNRKYLLGLYKSLPDAYASPEEYVDEIARNAPYARREHLRDLAAKALARKGDRWHRTYDREILARFDHYDLRGRLAEIRCPTLVIRGAESRVLGREAAEQMVRLLPAGELAEIPRATHPAHLDNPDGFREAVLGFLKKHGLL